MRAEFADTWKRDRWLKPFFKRYRRVLALALFLGVLSFLFAAALMFTAGYLISGTAARPESIFVLGLPLILVRVFGVGKPILHYFERLNSHDWVLHMTSELRLKLYRTLEQDALLFKATHRTGDILGLLAEDIGHIQNLFLRTVFPAIVAWIVALVVTVITGLFSPFMALALPVCLFSLTFVVPLATVAVNGARRMRFKQLRNELYAELTDNVLGVSDWVFAGRGKEYLERYRTAERAARDLMRAEERATRRRDLALQAFFAAVAVLLLVWAGLHFGGEQGHAANWIAAFVLGFFPLIEAFSPLSAGALDAVSYTDSVERLNALPTLRNDDPAQAPVPHKPFDICVQDVTYTYPGAAKPVLKGLSLTVRAGEKIAVLGRSGAGKSTLATLIRGDVVAEKGAVTFGGVHPHELGDEAHKYFGVIQQKTYLFNRTLLDNLRIGKPTATEEEVQAVLEQVGLGELAARLPQGLKTMVDEAGLRFSGGERHRIALARVLLQDTPVVILDEPTVGLDPLTEHEVLTTIFGALQDRTVIMITHHLQGVSLMDRVVFVEDGRVELEGTPQELARTSERYRTLQAFDRGIKTA